MPVQTGKRSLQALALAVLIAGVCVSSVRAQDPRPYEAPQPEQDAGFGQNAAAIDDVTGDGVPDLLVSTPDFPTFNGTTDNDESGKVHILSGASASIETTLTPPSSSSAKYFGTLLANVGDVNDDGTSDFVSVAPGEDAFGRELFVYSGADADTLYARDADDTEAGFDRFFSAAEGIPDVNGDGTPDFLVSNGRENRVYVYSGADGSILRTLTSPNEESGGQFGRALGSMPDMNGDQTPDILVGAPAETVNGTDREGRVYLFSGSDGTPLDTLTSPDDAVGDGSLFGTSVASVGDRNGDGTPDILVGAIGEFTSAVGSGVGRAFVLSGSDGSSIYEFDPLSRQDGASFGSPVASIGDVNGDGISDFLIGVTGADRDLSQEVGQAHVFSGSDAELLAVLESPVVESGAGFGGAVATPANIEGENPDVLIGASGETVDGKAGAGRAYLFTDVTEQENPTPTPVAQNLSATPSGSGVQVAWNGRDVGADDLAGWNVYRSTSPFSDSVDASRVAQVGPFTRFYVDTDVEVDATYYYRVAAEDTLGNQGGLSPLDSITVAPPAPSRLSAVGTDGPEVELDWDAVGSEAVTKYYIYRANSSIFGDPSEMVPFDSTAAATTTYTDTSVQRGSEYNYRITALSSSGSESAFSVNARALRDSLVAFASLAVDSAVTADFSASTGVNLAFSDTTVGQTAPGNTSVSVLRYADRPDDTTGIAETNVSPDRFQFLLSTQDLGIDSVQIQFAVGSLVGINNPENVTVYKSSFGTFDSLKTTVGTAGTSNDISDDTLYVSIDQISVTDDVVFASNTEPLPVEMTGLQAQVDGEQVRLTWATASEQNNGGFRIQRKVGTADNPDDSNSEEASRATGMTSGPRDASTRTKDWQTVGSVDGAGTTSQPQSYRFTDADLPYEADRLTYRLKQVDTDGSTSFSETVTVERGVDEVQLLGTAPNPAREQATVRYALPEKQEVTVRLYDVLGRQVRTVVSEKKEGRHALTLDVGDLSSGVYFLRLRADGEVRTQKMTVVR